MDDRAAAWWFFGTLVAFKIGTLILIFVFVASWNTLHLILASHVLWLLVPAALIWGPAMFWARLARARARRRELQRAEWCVEERGRQRLP